MSKERINVTVDEDVKEELTRREDINVSGAANEFFRRYLSGCTGEDAAKELKIQRLKAEEEELQENAQRKRAAWQKLQAEVNEEQENYKDALDRLLPKLEDRVRVWPEHKMVKRVANEHSKRPEQVIEDLRDAAAAEDIQTDTVDA